MVKAYAASKAKDPLKLLDYPALKELGPFDIEVKITHCGICHSDLHLIDNDWGNSLYPLIPGHEIIGTVANRGTHVDHLKLGQRVGIGWQRSSCLQCIYCLKGEENLCNLQEATCIGHPGGYAEKIFADSRFAFAIPDAIPSSHAGPLMCGGITVFSPFIEHNISPLMHVGVIGIGGLGHLALQFARAWGCEVSAISSSKDKEKEAKDFGAHHFMLHEALSGLENHFDLLLSTSTASVNAELYLKTLKPKGILCLLGAPPENIEVQIMSLISQRKIICGSNIGSRWAIEKMLHFAAFHQILPKIEEFPIEQVNEAIGKLRNNRVHYRAVLKMQK